LPRALISSLSPATGGVSAMQRTVLRLLAEHGYESTVAWYEPYSWSPRLSVPSYRLGRSRIGRESRPVAGALTGEALGAWLPELEFTHYWPTRHWRRLVAEHDVHLAASGNCLAALAFARTRTPFLAWIASDWWGDRDERVARMPATRRLLDALVIRPVVARLEPQILRRGRILALSEATRRSLDAVAGRPVVSAVLPYPVDVERFRVDRDAVVPGRIGFVGRLTDPRKRFTLFLDAVGEARRREPRSHAVVIGGEPTPELRDAVAARGLGEAVDFRGRLAPDEYAANLATLDVLAVTSRQEGLGIAALEAMASGCPVVSTRCGGPEEFVEAGLNGDFADSAASFAERLTALVSDRIRRFSFGQHARRTVETRYAWGRVREIFARELTALRVSNNRLTGEASE
jgi:glycosyltransferase involved in cell wall biosynthesis